MPKLCDAKKIAACGKYNVLPMYCEMLSDFTTPMETLRILKNVSTHCYLLESARADETWGRYTFLCFDPKMELTCINGEMKVGDLTFQTDQPSVYIRRVLDAYKSPRLEGLPPFTGGFVGYFSYDYVGYAEPCIKRTVQDTEQFKDVDLMLFDRVIAFDHVRQKIILIVNISLNDIDTGYNHGMMQLRQLCDLLRNGKKKREDGGEK